MLIICQGLIFGKDSLTLSFLSDESYYCKKQPTKIYMDVSKNEFLPQIIHFNRGFSIIITIHFGVLYPYFWFNIHMCRIKWNWKWFTKPWMGFTGDPGNRSFKGMNLSEGSHLQVFLQIFGVETCTKKMALKVANLLGKKTIYQAIQVVTFSCPIGGHLTFGKGSRELTIPKRSQSQNCQAFVFCSNEQWSKPFLVTWTMQYWLGHGDPFIGLLQFAI